MLPFRTDLSALARLTFIDRLPAAGQLAEPPSAKQTPLSIQGASPESFDSPAEGALWSLSGSERSEQKRRERNMATDGTGEAKVSAAPVRIEWIGGAGGLPTCTADTFSFFNAAQLQGATIESFPKSIGLKEIFHVANIMILRLRSQRSCLRWRFNFGRRWLCMVLLIIYVQKLLLPSSSYETSSVLFVKQSALSMPC